MINSLSVLNDDTEYVAVSDLHQKAKAYFYDYLTSDQKESLSFLSNDDEIIAYAKKIADRFNSFKNYHACYEDLVQVLCDIAYDKYEITPPLIKPNSDSDNTVTVTVPLPLQNNVSQIFPVTDTVTATRFSVTVSVTGVLFRLCDELWWRRKLRKYYKRKLETASIYYGKVNSRKGKYVSDDGLTRFRNQKRRNRRVLENTIATNELGQEFTLQELSDKNVSNPELRRNELMTRVAGFENIAKSQNHIGMFYTITCPSRMHAVSSITGKRNLKFDGTTPDLAQKYLVNIWAKIRTKLSNTGIKLYGIRVAEPQHDGTPHWHLLMFMPKEQKKIVSTVIQRYSMLEDGKEAGAKKHRYRAVFIDPKIGSATGYVAKYLSKNINGYGLDSDIDGSEPISASERVNAWANHWGIRQFQLLGGPPVGLWREIRKIGGSGLKGIIKHAQEAADKASWDSFVNLLGGVLAKRKELAITLAKESTEKLNHYLEPIGKEIIGITDGLEIVKTRIHIWIVKYKSNSSSEKVFEFGFRALAPLEFCQ